jgi:cleavage and polyadenylation specificity factor subunit 3
MSMSQVVQRQSIHYSRAMPVLRHLLTQVAGTVEVLEEKKLRIFQNVDLTLDNKIVTLEVQ